MDNLLVCHHVAWAVVSLLCFWFHIQENFFQVWDWICYMSLEGSGLILLTMMSMLLLLTSMSVLVLFSRGDLIIFLAGSFVGVLSLIWSILMVECISKVSVDNRVNHWFIWIHVNISGFQGFKYKFYFLSKVCFSWSICGERSNFLKEISKEVM